MKKIIACVVIILSILSTSAYALDNGLEASQFRPVTDNGSYFGTWDSNNLYQKEWRLGTFMTYEYRPFQLTRNGNRQQGIIDNSIIQHLTGSYGIFDKWLSVGFDLPVGWLVDYRNPNVAGSAFSNDMAIGDLRINLKSQLYGSHCKKFGLAFIPFIDIPTGYGSKFFGNGTVQGGGFIALDYKPWRKVSFSLNLGMTGRSTYNFRDIERKLQLMWSLAAKYKFNRKWSLNTEILSQTRLTGIYSEAVESPTEWLAGVKYKIGETGLTASLGTGMGITHGSMSPRFRVFTGLTYTPLKRNIYKLKKAMNETNILFDSGAHVIKAEEAGKLATLKKWLKKTYGLPIKISGHTDIESDEAYNQDLSVKRAQEVKTYLVANKIKAKRLSTEGFGESKPIANNKTEEGKAANRRVEFKKSWCK
ncbi:MAG: OmpA family protein [bacterium]|nr:OmpA family protein [bacterium]MBU1918572.1 OmpA family protein [bacterium]